MLWRLSVFLVVILLGQNDSVAQEESYKPFYVELHVAPLLGISTDAEIKGGYDSLSYDNQEHLVPAFKGTTSLGLVFGYGRKTWELQGTISYFRQDMTLVTKTNWSNNGPKLATSNFISTRVSALLILDEFNRWPYGWYSGVFVGTLSSISHAVDPGAKATYGITEISTQTELNWGIETNLSFALGKKGFYGNLGISLTMPGTIGGVGTIKSNSSGYTIVNDTIVLYPMTCFMGVGFRMGNSNP